MDGLPKHSLALLLAAAALGAPAQAGAKTLWFSGMSWTVRPNGVGGPNNNTWCEANAFVDANGALHLKITKSRGNKWCSAEIVSDYPLGFGVYQFQLESRVDLIDRNVVLGLFTYPTPDVGPDTTHEIDIEFSRWGQAGASPLNYTVWPVSLALDPTTKVFPMALSGNASTPRFIWQSRSIRFQSTHGFYDDNPFPIADWTFAPADYAQRIAQRAMPLHMNLWLFGKAPSDGRPVEFVIRQFKFTPL